MSEPSINRKFPVKKYAGISEYASDYFMQLRNAYSSINFNNLSKAAEILEYAYRNNKWVYVCGNGGSAALANHYVCDHGKLVKTLTNFVPKIYSLSTNIEMITAISNDISYNDIFEYQLKGLATKGDVLFTISSSGDSENVVRALIWSKENNVRTISLTGFNGGRSSKLADVNIHVGAHNYGVIEDVHQSIIQILAQYIRQTDMEEGVIYKEKF